MCIKSIIEVVLSLCTVILSIIAVIVSVYTTRKQNKIALFEKRMFVFDKIENYVANLYLWEFDFSWFLKLSLNKTQILSLFDTDFLEFYNYLEIKSKKINELRGDSAYAREKGSCKNRNEEQIEDEISELIKQVDSRFEKLKDRVYNKFFKL